MWDRSFGEDTCQAIHFPLTVHMGALNLIIPWESLRRMAGEEEGGGGEGLPSFDVPMLSNVSLPRSCGYSHPCAIFICVDARDSTQLFFIPSISSLVSQGQPEFLLSLNAYLPGCGT